MALVVGNLLDGIVGDPGDKSLRRRLLHAPGDPRIFRGDRWIGSMVGLAVESEVEHFRALHLQNSDSVFQKDMDQFSDGALTMGASVQFGILIEDAMRKNYKLPPSGVFKHG